MTLLEDFYRQNEWATLRLIEVCRGLGEEQLEASAEGTYGSIRATLLHYIAAEPSYVTRLGGEFAGPRLSFEGAPDFDQLAEAARQSAAGLIDRAEQASRETWSYTTAEGEDIDAEAVLVQALNHGVEHRTHICTILTTLGIQPPALDGWTWAEETGRARMP